MVSAAFFSKTLRRFLQGFAVWVCLAWVSPSFAVILSDGTGAENVTSTGAGDGWSYVGSVNGASGVYLGDYNGGYWVLTANHVGGGTFTLGGVPYNLVAGSGQQIAGVDLYVFRIDVAPTDTAILSLAPINLSTSSPTTGSAVTMIGYGRNRAVGQTTYYVDVDPNPYVWSETPTPGTDTSVNGYKFATGNTKRWGGNVIAGSGTVNGATELNTSFSSSAGDSQVASGDSGGGMFYYNGTSWELSGLLNLAGTYSGQPTDTAVFGNLSYAVSIAAYHDDIINAIPEPRTWGFLVLGLAVVGFTARRRFTS